MSSSLLETRDLLNTAILAYQALRDGTVAINGSTGAVLGRSLMGLRDLVDSTLSEIRIAAKQQRRERVLVTPFLKDIAGAGRLHAESRGLQLVIAPGDSVWAINADPQVLASAVTNLQRRRPVSSVRRAPWRRPYGPWLRAVDCSKGRQGARRRHPHSQRARHRLRLHDRRTAGKRSGARFAWHELQGSRFIGKLHHEVYHPRTISGGVAATSGVMSFKA